MIKLENYEVMGWEHAIRGMRNPMNSWEKIDTEYKCPYNVEKTGVCTGCNENICIGPNDHELMMKLAKGGSVHAKYRRMITVYVDITAPLYWWKEFDTYKVGTVANSCSTMHKIHEKEFTLEDFSCEHLMLEPLGVLKSTIRELNIYRDAYNNGVDDVDENTGERIQIDPKDKRIWNVLIQLLPSSYNQKRTVMLNYEVLANIYESRNGHKLDEWNDFCKWIESLPYSELITGTNCCHDCEACDNFDCKNTPDEEEK